MDRITKTIIKAYTDYCVDVLNEHKVYVIMAKSMNMTPKALEYRFQKDNWSWREIEKAIEFTKDIRLKALITETLNK